MSRSLNLCLLLLLALIVTACGDDTQFRIEGVVDGLGTRPVTLTYVGDGGSLQQNTIVAIDGKFSLTGTSKNYTIAELSTSDLNVIASMLVRNGQTLKCKLNLSEPDKNEISGNSPSEEWLQFLQENADSLNRPLTANRVVARYVSQHPSSIVSSVLLLTAFNSRISPLEADSLMSVIKPEARPESMVDGYRLLLSAVNSAAVNAEVKSFTLLSAGDSIERYYPTRYSCTLLAFTGSRADRRDTIAPMLKQLRDSINGRRLHIVEVSTEADSVAWRNVIAADSANWTQVWVPAAAAYAPFEAIQLPYTPYYVVSDSIGRLIYRGPSGTDAVNKATNHIKNR